MRLHAFLIALGFFLAAAPPPARAGEDPDGAADRLKAASPEGKARLAERLARWKSMSDEQKTRLRERLQSFRALPEEEKAEIAERAKEWKKKAPEKKGEIERRLGAWKDLPGLWKETLAQRLKALGALPEEESRRLSALPEGQRTAEFERIFLRNEVKRLASRLAPEERRSLEGLELPQQKGKALAILREKRAAHLARVPGAVRDSWDGLPAPERAKAEEHVLKEIAFRDQKVLAVLSGAARAEFLKAPPDRRDETARRLLAALPEADLAGLPPAERNGIDEAPPEERPWKILDARFARASRRALGALLPAQQRALKDLPPSKQWERARFFLKENHRRLLAKIPPALRREIEGLPPEAQLRRIRAFVEDELKRHPAGRLQRKGNQELPLLLLLDALQRFKRETPREGRGRD